MFALPTPGFGFSSFHPPVFILFCPLGQGWWWWYIFWTKTFSKSLFFALATFVVILYNSTSLFRLFPLTLAQDLLQFPPTVSQNFIVFILTFFWGAHLRHYHLTSPEQSLFILPFSVFLYSFMLPSFSVLLLYIFPLVCTFMFLLFSFLELWAE